MKIKLKETQLRSLIDRAAKEVYYRKKIRVIEENMKIFYENNEQTIEKEAEKIQDATQADGLPISQTDANSLVSAFGAGIATIASGTGIGIPIGWSINAVLLSKALYDYTQSLSAAEKANDILENALGRPVLQGAIDAALSHIPVFGAVFNRSLSNIKMLSEEEVLILKSLPPEQFAKLSQYLVSSLQYKRRMWVDMLGAVPAIPGEAVIDAALKAIGGVIAVAPIDKMLISMTKASTLLVDNFPGILALSDKDNFIGKGIRFLLNYELSYNLGAIYDALDLLEPGAGDHLHQYVDMKDSGRGSAQKDVVDYYVNDANQQKRDQKRLDRAEVDIQLAEVFKKIDIIEAKQKRKRTKRDPRKDFLYPYAYGIGRRRDYEEDEDDIPLDMHVFGGQDGFGDGGDGGE